MSERWVDVSHEALIRSWPRLRGWIEEDRAGLRLHRRLTEAAQEWHKSRDESALYRGARLAQAVEWRERHNPALNDLERAFLDASLALQQHETRVRERQRRRLISGLSAALVVFALLAGLAFLQWRQAYKQGQIALARQLGAQANLLGNHPERLFRRLLLATEAMKRLHAVATEAPEVELVFREALALLLRHLTRQNVENWHGDLRLSPDGRYVIAGHFDSNDARVWEIATGKELVRFKGEGRGFTATFPDKVVRFQMAGDAARNHMPTLSGDGKYVVTEADDGAEGIAQVWETDTGRELLRLQLSGRHRYELSADGRYLAVSTSAYDRATNKFSEKAITSVWDVRAQRELPGSTPGYVRAISQNGPIVATSQGLWEVAAELKPILNWELETFEVALSSDGEQVAIAAERAGQKQIEVWSRTTKKMTASMPNPNADAYLRAVTPDGRFIILTDSERNETQVYDITAKASAARATLVGDAVALPSGQYVIASLQPDGNERANAVDVWALGREGGDVLAIDHQNKVVAVGLAPSGGLTTIAQNGEKLLIRAWDVKTRREMPERAAEVTGTTAIFAPDDQSFAVLSNAGLEVRRIDNPEPVAKFAYANPAAVLWSPDGRYLAAQRDQDVRVWELKTRQSICQLTLPERPISLSFTKGGDALAAVFSGGEARAGERQYAKLWSVVNGKELKSFEPSVGADYSKLLNLADTSLEIGMGADLAQRKGINTDGRVVALDQESGYLVTISDRNTVRVWLLRPEDVIEEACRRLPRNLTADEWREYVKDDAYRKTCPKLP